MSDSNVHTVPSVLTWNQMRATLKPMNDIRLMPVSAVLRLLSESASRYRRSDVANIERAVRVADIAHMGQSRDSAQGRVPYITHPVNVARRLMLAGAEPDVVVAAVLHDVQEDGHERVQRLLVMDLGSANAVIHALFGANVARIVDIVSVRAQESYPQAVRRASEDEQAFRVKWSDFLDNVMSLGNLPEQRARKLSRKYSEVIGIMQNGAERWSWGVPELEEAESMLRSFEL